MKCDVLVVGAGPAGSMTARVLAERGIDVLLVDRAAFPRDKPCGGFLPARANALLPGGRLPGRLVERWITGCTLHAPSGKSVVVDYPGPACTVSRREFDAWLLESSGAPFLRARLVDGRRRGRVWEISIESAIQNPKSKIRARLVVGCDGAASTVAGMLGLRSPPASRARTVQRFYPMPPETVKARTGDRFLVFYSALVPGGYGWVSPLRAGVKVGAGTTDPRAARDLDGRFDKLLATTIAGAVVAGTAATATERWPIPAGVRRRPGGPGALLAGDAGGFTGPGTGEGIFFAMMSGTLAAEAAVEHLSSGRPLLPLYIRRLREAGLYPMEGWRYHTKALGSGAAMERYVVALSRMANSCGGP